MNRFAHLLIILSLLLPNASALSAAAGWSAQDAAETPTPTPAAEETPAVEETSEPTAAPADVATPTLQIIPSSTPVPTETLPGPTPTLTPAPLETEALDALDLLLGYLPGGATPGGLLELDVHLDGLAALTPGLRLSLLPPKGVLPQANLALDASSGAYALEVAETEQVIAWQIPAELPGPYEFQASLSLDSKELLQRSLLIPETGLTRLALRTGSGTGTSGLLYLFGDHLGSTSQVANPDGSAYTGGEQRYKPWGEQRYPSGASTLPTSFQYTGQRVEASLSIYY